MSLERVGQERRLAVRVPGTVCGMEGIPVCLGRIPSIMSNIKVRLNGEKSHKQGPFGFCG